MAAQNEYKPPEQNIASAKQMEENLQNQRKFTQAMQLQAAGQGPSAAQEMFKSAAQNQVAQANAMAASQQGNVNAGLASRNAAQQAATANQQMTGQAAAMRAQEQNQAQQMLGGQANTMTAQGAQAQQYKTGLESGIAQQNVDAQNKVIGSVTGGLMGAVGGLASGLVGSDENIKKNVKDGSPDVRKFLDALGPNTYEYKNPSQPGASEGQHTSVMAQDLEKSDMGKQMVQDTPHGKMVDYNQGLASILAAQADLHKRLKAVEGNGSKPHYAEGTKQPIPEPKPLEMAPVEGAPAAPGASSPSFAQQVLGSAGKGIMGSASKDIKDPFERGSTQLGEAAGMALRKGMAESDSMDAAAMQEKAPIDDAPQSDVWPEMEKKQPSQSPDLVLAKGGKVPAMVSPGEIYLPPGKAAAVAKGVASPKAGERIPGKASVKGDSKKNDTVKKDLQAGGIVIPRSKAGDEQASIEFVRQVFARKGKR